MTMIGGEAPCNCDGKGGEHGVSTHARACTCSCRCHRWRGQAVPVKLTANPCDNTGCLHYGEWDLLTKNLRDPHHVIQGIVATLRGHVANELGDDAKVFVTPRGYAVDIPSRQRFEAETLDEAINMAKSWKEMMGRE